MPKKSVGQRHEQLELDCASVFTPCDRENSEQVDLDGADETCTRVDLFARLPQTALMSRDDTKNMDKNMEVSICTDIKTSRRIRPPIINLQHGK